MKKEKRLTDNIYGENPIHVGAERTTAIYEKCYALEDIMEKYDIKDLKELDKIVDQWKTMIEALEIIKGLILKDLVFDDKEQEINFSFGISTLCIKIKDKEKYDLLKEVML